MNTPRFWQLLVRDDYTRERPGWYWQDDDCEEPMGPFESRAEAADDYQSLRAFAKAMSLVSSSDTGQPR